MFKTKLKVSQSENINNIIVSNEAVELLKSAKGWEYAEVQVGDHTVIVDDKFVHTLRNGAISVGIKDNFKYKLKDSDATVKGTDLMRYFKEIHIEKKETKENASKKEATTTKTKEKK